MKHSLATEVQSEPQPLSRWIDQLDFADGFKLGAALAWLLALVMFV